MEKEDAQTYLMIKPDLAQQILQDIGQNVFLCYQCVKCTSGCPLAEFFDWQPNQVMRAVQLGQEDISLHSQTPWLCASCQTCTTRCPQGLDITAIMEYLARESVKRGNKPPISQVNSFNQAFLREVRLWGRAYEPGLMAEMVLRDPSIIIDDIDLYIRMLKKRKVSFLPAPARRPHKAKMVPGAADAVAYYPGCSLDSTATEFNHSAQAVCTALGIRLVEPDGWVCCGSTAAHRSDPETALRLPMENLVLIEQSGFREVTMPCASCFNRHKVALHEIRANPEKRKAIDRALDYTYQDTVKVTSLTLTILQHIGVEQLAKSVTNPLSGLKAVCYYGCLMTRPPEVTEATHPENPTDMDEILSALGIEVLDWSYKTICCGAAHSLTRPDVVHRLSGDLIRHAHEAGADLIAVACPLCHLNLDSRQFQMGLDFSMPILYFTQLMALALGLPAKAAALHKNMVDPRPLLLKEIRSTLS
jgi:heterodisulfide reductase subunit B